MYYRGDWGVNVDVAMAGWHRGFIMYTLLVWMEGKSRISWATEVVWRYPKVNDFVSEVSTRGKDAC